MLDQLAMAFAEIFGIFALGSAVLLAAAGVAKVAMWIERRFF